MKSEAGDSETTFYGLRKYASLLAQGNPTVMTLLFTPNLIHPDEIGLQDQRAIFLSKRLVARHIGYADSMHARLTGARAPRTNRPELVDKYGYDCKAAFHALRLLIQGHEMLTTGAMQMPMREDHRNYLLDIRHGQVSMDEVLSNIALWRERIQGAEVDSPLPTEPDHDAINEWLINTHESIWAI